MPSPSSSSSSSSISAILARPFLPSPSWASACPCSCSSCISGGPSSAITPKSPAPGTSPTSLPSPSSSAQATNTASSWSIATANPSTTPAASGPAGMYLIAPSSSAPSSPSFSFGFLMLRPPPRPRLPRLGHGRRHRLHLPGNCGRAPAHPATADCSGKGLQGAEEEKLAWETGSGAEIRWGAAYTLNRLLRTNPSSVMLNSMASCTARLDGAPTAARIGNAGHKALSEATQSSHARRRAGSCPPPESHPPSELLAYQLVDRIVPADIFARGVEACRSHQRGRMREGLRCDRISIVTYEGTLGRA